MKTVRGEMFAPSSSIADHPYLHETFQLVKLAVQIFKVLFEKFPESIVKHDFDQNTERLFFRHLSKREQNRLPLKKRKKEKNLNTLLPSVLPAGMPS